MRVAIVAAETREIATQALELIEADYQLLPVISDPVQARQPGVPELHPSGNLLKHIKVRKGDIEQGFAEADDRPGADVSHRHHRARLHRTGVQHRKADTRRADGSVRRLANTIL
jgi:CO/xanthine dehydrogenase Mo-binding subunit